MSCPLNVWKSLTPRYYFSVNRTRYFRSLLAKNFILKSKYQNVRLVLGHFSALPLLWIMIWFLSLRLQQRSIERAMDLTNSFTWEDMPTRDAHTGHLTAAGWIPLTMKYSVRIAIAVVCFHTVQSTVRMVTNHETMVAAWYPFDWTVSPFYELVNISQVTVSVNKIYKILNRTYYIIFNSTAWHNEYISFFRFFLPPFLLSSMLPVTQSI